MTETKGKSNKKPSAAVNAYLFAYNFAQVLG